MRIRDKEIRRLYNLLAVVPFSLASLPDRNEFLKLEKLVNKKDVHVVAAALEIHAPYLLTPDKGLVLEVNKAHFGIQAFSPGKFIKSVVPHHVDYPSGGNLNRSESPISDMKFRR